VHNQWDFDPKADNRKRRRLGVQLQLPPCDLHGKYTSDTKSQNYAILVAKVNLGGAACSAGVWIHDLILKINGISVTDLPGAKEDFIDAFVMYLQRCPEDDVSLLVSRNDKEHQLTVRLLELDEP
jgi:C-terminal processing protease CtpA/Prc